MNIKITFVFLYLFLFSCNTISLSQNKKKNDLTIANLNGKVKSIKSGLFLSRHNNLNLLKQDSNIFDNPNYTAREINIINFNEEGNIIERTKYNYAGEVKAREINSYNSKGQIIEKKEFKKYTNKLEAITKYFYNKNALLERALTFDVKNRVDEIRVYTYNSSNYLELEASFRPKEVNEIDALNEYKKDSLVSFYYKKNINELTEWRFELETGKLKNKNKYVFNKKGRINKRKSKLQKELNKINFLTIELTHKTIEKKIYNSLSSNVWTSNSYNTYDELGCKIKEEFPSYYYMYTYNNKGALIEEKAFGNNGKMSSLKTHKINPENNHKIIKESSPTNDKIYTLVYDAFGNKIFESSTQEKYSYTYDSQNNWVTLTNCERTKVSDYKECKPRYFAIQEIEYYKQD